MILKPLPPEPKLKLDSELLSLISETDTLLSEIELLTKFISPNFFELLKLNEAIHSYSLDNNTGWNLESYYLNPETAPLVNKIIYSSDLAQKILKDVKPSRLINTIHKELFGEEKEGGSFRNQETKSNFSLPDGAAIPELMHSLEQYLLNNTFYHPLIDAALVHAQFELIHPFNSHNGITGRILMLLHFIWKRKLSFPVLQTSKILRSKKVEYFDRLDDLARNNNWNNWIKFMLHIYNEAAKFVLDYAIKFNNISGQNYLLLIEKNIATTTSLKLHELIKRKPVLTIQQIITEISYSKQTLSLVISKFLEEKIIEEISGKQRYRVFKNKQLLNIFA